MSWWNPKTWFRSEAPQASYSQDAMTEDEIIAHIVGGYGGVMTASGMAVNEESAMRVSTVYRCVTLLSGTIASLPCEVYESGGNGYAELAREHPAYYLLHNEASPLMTAHSFWRAFLRSAFMHKTGGVGLISRTPGGKPTAISWVHPSRCQPQLNPDKTRLQYRIHLPSGQTALFDQDDVLHWSFGGRDGFYGLAPLDCARPAIALAYAGQEFNERFFSQGSAADVAFEFPQKVDSEQAKLIFDTWERNHTGLSKQRRPLIADGGGTVKRMDYKADESQLVESRMFQVEDICRFYGVPPHMVGHTSKSTSWGSGLEEQTLGFVKFTLRDILKGLEQEIDRKLLRSARHYSKFNLEALLRADSKGRAEFYKVALGGTQNPGFLTVNEVRTLENRPPVPGGDALYVPVAKDTTRGESTNV